MRLHAVLSAGLDRLPDLGDLVLADQVADAPGSRPAPRRPRSGPGRRRACSSVCATTPCSEDASWARICLLGRRVDVDDPVDGLLRRAGVQGREHQVTGLGGGQRHRDGLQVAHLADQDDVRVLPQHVPQGVGEGLGVLAHLALVDDAALVLEEELDRVLDGHDVAVAGAVGEVHHRGERGRLARAGRAGDQHQAARQPGERRQALGHARARPGS